MSNALYFFEKIDSFISLLTKPVTALISAAIALTLSYGIFTRAALDAPVFGLEELVLMGAMWLYMIGAVLACRERSHLTADFVQVITSNKNVISGMRLLSTCISLFMAVMFAMWSFDLLIWGIKKGQTTPVFQLPWYLSQSSLFVASTLFIFYLIRDFISDALEFKKLINKQK